MSLGKINEISRTGGYEPSETRRMASRLQSAALPKRRAGGAARRTGRSRGVRPDSARALVVRREWMVPPELDLYIS
jgi:hypothetical protein